MESRDVAWSGFSAAFRRGRNEVLLLRLLHSRSGGFDIRRHRPSTWLPWITSSLWPLVPAVVAAAVPVPWRARFDMDDWTLLGLFAAINAGVIAAAALAWNYATNRADTVDALMRTSMHREFAVRPLAAALSVRGQLVVPMLFGTVPVAYLGYLLTSRGAQPLEVWILSGVSLWTLLLTGNAIWWLLVPPLVVWRLRAAEDLNLRWHDPAHTPGIRTLAEGYGFSSMFLVLAAIAVTIPGLTHRPVFGQAAPILYGLLVGVSLWIGMMTQLVIYLIVRRARLRSIDSLAVEEVPTSASASHNTSEQLSVYSSLLVASNLPYGSGAVVQYLAALGGSVVGLVLQTKG